MSDERRLVGIDLGIASAHTVRVLRGDGSEVCRRRCWPRLDSLREIEQAALEGAPPETRLEVVMEPSGSAWLPVAIYFCSRGHTVYRVSSAKAHDLRRFLSRNAKSNGIDADTLARLPLVDTRGLLPLELPDAPRASLGRRVRVSARLTRQVALHKQRIKDLVRQLLPMTPLEADLGQADLAVLQHTGGHPERLVELGLGRLTRLIAKASKNHLGRERAQAWLDAAHLALELYAGHPAVAYDDLAAEVGTEVRLLRASQAELPAHEAIREQAYREVDPEQLARSLPGVAAVSAPAVVTFLGQAERFPSRGQARSFAGLAPRASETGQSDRKGQPISKAGPTLLRTTFVRAADNARQYDPQLARIYYIQMVERGAEHIKALCVVAARLAELTWMTLRRGTPYELRDTDGRPISHAEGRAIVAQQWKVPEEVRRRRRSHKRGKAPQQVRAGHARIGDCNAATRRPPLVTMVEHRLTPIKEVLEAVLEGTDVPS